MKLSAKILGSVPNTTKKGSGGRGDGARGRDKDRKGRRRKKKMFGHRPVGD